MNCRTNQQLQTKAMALLMAMLQAGREADRQVSLSLLHLGFAHTVCWDYSANKIKNLF